LDVNLATLRRLALNLLKRDKTKKRGIKGKQLDAGWDHAYLLRLLAIWMRLPWWFELFLVPIGNGEGVFQYQALFNRQVA